MDRDIRAHFESVIELARARLTNVRVAQNDITIHRAILEIHGKYNNVDVRIKEIYSQTGDLFSYYVLQDGTVLVGFDNYPDVIVIKAKFGNKFKQHLDARISHRHGYGKQSVVIVAEQTAKDFLANLEQFLIRDNE
jgi:hypothetical protein